MEWEREDMMHTVNDMSSVHVQVCVCVCVSVCKSPSLSLTSTAEKSNEMKLMKFEVLTLHFVTI